jgi:hypothetical protein
MVRKEVTKHKLTCDLSLTIFGNQRYHDDLKHVDCDFIDFQNLIIQQDKSLGKGGLVSILDGVGVISFLGSD